MSDLREAINALEAYARNWVQTMHPTDDESRRRIDARIDKCVAALSAQPQPEAVEPVARAWQRLLDKDDRTSPEEYPDMALITFDEFQDAILALSTRAGG